MKNKILSITLLVIFLISLFPALAQDNTKQIRKYTKDSSEDNTLTEVAETKRLGNQSLLVKVRKINQNLVKRYTEIRDKFTKAKQLQVEAKEDFVQTRLRLKECEGSDTAECVQVRESIETKARNFLGNSADAIITHLEKIKNKIQTNTRLTEEEVNELVSEIDAKIQKLEDAKAESETAETKEGIVEAAKTINAAWKPVKTRSLYWAGRLINSRMGGIVEKMEHLEERLKRTLERMEESGKDTSEIDPLIDEFHSLLTSAKDNFDSAKENYQQFKETEDKTYLDTGKRYMNEARNNLVEAHKKLKEIVRAIKTAEGSDELKEVTEETLIEETEEV